MKSNIKVGNKVRCLVTGFTGIATARIKYLNGCIQFCVAPKVGKDEKKPDGEYIDEGQLKVIGKGLYIEPKKTGGPDSNIPNGLGLSRR